MCGIAGILMPPGQLVAEPEILAMGRALGHRGPDSHGTLQVGELGLAHTRLSVIDPTPAAEQPFCDQDHALVFNGEIYNYKELAALLTGQGIGVRGPSDTAVLFAALTHWGVSGTLDRLRGMFAFAFANFSTKTVYLCRDRLGIKPLYWNTRGGRLQWASEIKALTVLGGIEPDPVMMLASLAGGIESHGSRTCFAGVSQVEPGTYLACEPGQAPRAEPYFDLSDLVDESRYRELDGMPTSKVIAEFGSLLTSSVSSMLMSDVPMGALLSGGLDSAVVVAVAARLGAEPTLFTCDVSGSHSEVAKARRVAAAAGLPLREARFSPGDLVAGWARQTWFYEAPIITFPNAIALAAVTTLAHADGVKPVLTGEGSDELFLGYSPLARGRYVRLASAPLKALEALYGRVSPGLRSLVFPGASGDGPLAMIVDAARDDSPRYDPEALFPFLRPSRAREQVLTLELLRGQLRALLHRADRMGMQAGIEARFPFLDEELLRFGVNLPVRHKIALVPRRMDAKHPFLMDKAVVRRWAKGLVPPEIALSPKQGFPVHGLETVKVSASFFDKAHARSVTQLSQPAFGRLLDRAGPATVARLASVEVFGRLYAGGEPWEAVEESTRSQAAVSLA